MTTPLYEAIYLFMLEEIRSGRLREGDRVMSEKELAERFGVSRITSKSALTRLAQTGVIERARGKGSFVSKPLPDMKHLGAPSKTASPAARLSVLAPAAPFGGALADSSGQFAPTDTVRPETSQAPTNSLHTVAGQSETAAVNESVSVKRMIGLVIPGFADTYGTSLVQAVERRCSELGFDLLIKNTYGKQDVEEAAITRFVEVGVGGIIVFPVHGEHYNAKILRLVLDGFPLVLVDRYLKGIPACAVYTDNQRAAEDLTDHLLDLGHRDIAFITPPPENTSSIVERIQGFTAAFARRGASIRADRVFTDVKSTVSLLALDPEASHVVRDRECLEIFVQAHPEISAYVACEFEVALLIQLVLNRLGRKVPDDCSVVCFDHYWAAYSDPFFTHVEQDQRLMGETAVDHLVSQIRGMDVPFDTLIPYRLVRASSAQVHVSQTRLVKPSRPAVSHD